MKDNLPFVLILLSGYDPNGQMYGGPGQQPQDMAYPGQTILADPMANMAMQYGQNLAGQGRDIMHRNVRILLLESIL